MTQDACLAGKDVYVEKPMTSVAEQGPPLVRTVRETKRIVQVGVQQRSGPHYIEAKQRIIGPGFPADADPHLKHWLECIRSRRQPNADAVSGHFSAMPCHMGNLAYKAKSRVKWNSKWDV